MKIWKRLKMMMNSPRICYRNIPPWMPALLPSPLRGRVKLAQGKELGAVEQESDI
jgi:hypothetical protein